MIKPPKEWIIQRCTQGLKSGSKTDLEYEDYPDYCERLVTRPEMMRTLSICQRLWPDNKFRGHNAAICDCPAHINAHARAREAARAARNRIQAAAAALAAAPAAADGDSGAPESASSPQPL